LGRFLSLKHRAMPRTRDPVWAHFTETEEQYQGELTGQTKTRIKCKCEFGCAPFVFRNVDQLFSHLASPSEGLGKSSGCAHVKSAAPAVQIKYAAEIVSRAAAKTAKKKTEQHHGASTGVAIARPQWHQRKQAVARCDAGFMCFRPRPSVLSRASTNKVF
jgi:hypothetical protein